MRRRRSRWLAVAALTSAVSVALAGCAGTDGAGSGQIEIKVATFGELVDHIGLHVADAGIAEALRQKKAQQLAIFRELFAVHSYIGLHRLRGGHCRIARFRAVAHAIIRKCGAMEFCWTRANQ